MVAPFSKSLDWAGNFRWLEFGRWRRRWAQDVIQQVRMQHLACKI